MWEINCLKKLGFTTECQLHKTDAQMEDNIYGVALPLRRYYLPSVLSIDYGDYVRAGTMKMVVMKIEYLIEVKKGSW